MLIELTAEEVEWAGVSLRQARDQLAEEDSNWDGSEPGNREAVVPAMEAITSLLKKLGENEHPGFRLAVK